MFSEEQANALQLIGQSFKGTFRLTFVVVMMQLIFAGLAVYCAYHLVNVMDIGLKKLSHQNDGIKIFSLMK